MEDAKRWGVFSSLNEASRARALVHDELAAECDIRIFVKDGKIERMEGLAEKKQQRVQI